MNGFALVGDLQASRLASDRRRLGARIEKVLRALGRTFAEDWLAPLVTTRGLDEVSGLLRRPDHAFDVAVALNLELWPRRFRVALAHGAIDVAPGSGDASAMDGPAFHAAADALERARRDDLALAVALPGLAPEAAALVEALARMHHAVVSGWSPRMAAVVAAYRRHGTQAKVADALGITQQAVSKALRSARWPELVAAESALRAWLGRYERPR
ncbi:MAG: hypothetical protein KBD01_18145 [Acidobacteria bacterium]|nr:hypothetical protein [Acidobacteriota bacterium]